MSGSKIALPKVTIALRNADREVENTPQKVLLVGQKLAGGSATAGALVTNLSSEGAPESALFGAGSQLAAMVRAFKKVNPIVRLDAIPLADAGGAVARAVAFTVVGPATAAGSITLTIGSAIDHVFEVAIASGDTETVIADAIEAAVNADLKCPLTAANVAGLVTLTARNGGTVANSIGVGVEIEDATGVSVASVAQTVAGATDPTLTGVLDVATERYQTIVWPYASSLTVVAAYLSPRFNATNAILDGVAVATLVDSHANILAAANALNDKNLVLIADEVQSETLYKGPAIVEPSYSVSAIFAGIRSLRLTEDENISRFLTSSATLDQFGGPAIASLPYFNTPVDVIAVIQSGRGWTQTEIDQLLDAGASVIGNNPSGTSILLGDFVTTYKTDPASNPDVTFHFLNYVDTGSNVREYFFNNLKARFAQSRLTEGAVSRGRDMANGAVIRAYCEKLYQDLAGPDFVLVQDGEDALQFFKENLFITLDLAEGKVTIEALVPIVTQLREIIATMRIAFSTAS